MGKSINNKIIDVMVDFMSASFVGAVTLRRIINLTAIFGIANILTGFSHKGNSILIVMAIINLLGVSIYTGMYLGSR